MTLLVRKVHRKNRIDYTIILMEFHVHYVAARKKVIVGRFYVPQHTATE